MCGNRGFEHAQASQEHSAHGDLSGKAADRAALNYIRASAPRCFWSQKPREVPTKTAVKGPATKNTEKITGNR